MSEKSAFSELGLTMTEASVLESLVSGGPASGSAVAARLGLHKSVAYFVLEQLVQKGWASSAVVNGKRRYSPLEESLLRLRLKSRKNEFLDNFGAISGLLDAGRKKGKTSFSVFEGWDGIRLALDSILEGGAGGSMLIFSVDVKPNVFPRMRRLVKGFHEDRVNAGIPCKIMISSKLRSTLGADRMNQPLTSVRFVSSEFSMPTAATTIKDKVLLAVWTDEPIAIIIDNRDVAQSFNAFFSLIWKQARP